MALITPHRELIKPQRLDLSGLGGGMQTLDGVGGGKRYGSSGGGGSGSLQDTVASCVFDLDATIADSYPGSGQTWFNLVASPADGSSQDQYDYYLGAGSGVASDDPTFTGSAGSSSAYFALDSGDNFTPVSGTIPNFVKNMHKTTGGTPTTLIMAMQSGAAGYYIGTGPTSGASGYDGVYWYKTDTTLLIDQFGAGSYGRSSLSVTGDSTPMVLAVAFDYTASTIKRASNARTFTSGTMVKVTATADPFYSFKIGSNGQGAKTGGSCRIYGIYAFNAILSDAEMDDIMDVLNARHGRTYA
jgi:hypothetical protein